MSFRSALASPTTQNGGVGTIVQGFQTAPINFATGVEVTTSSVTLGKGVWHITMRTKLYLSTASVITAYINNLKVGGVELMVRQQYATNPLTVALDDYLEEQLYSVPVNITADGTLVELTQQMDFTGGLGIVSMFPLDGTLGAIYCVKIA